MKIRSILAFSLAAIGYSTILAPISGQDASVSSEDDRGPHNIGVMPVKTYMNIDRSNPETKPKT
jgi:hypothetical protein